MAMMHLFSLTGLLKVSLSGICLNSRKKAGRTKKNEGVCTISEDKVTIVAQYHGVRREKEIPAKWMKMFRVDGLTFAISVGQSYYWDAKQEKWRFRRKLYRPDLFVLDVWGQYNYLMPLDYLIPVTDWEDLTGADGDSMLLHAVTHAKRFGRPLIDWLKDHELTGKGGFL